ncbi:arsenate reductase (glutaredoxin) [Arenimonas sp.]|uniref:arsenate reductase (glutaredoxin) n=1 Tax=Arenimonas sp. TaxID=1872635 RepID=UPI0039E255B1
MPDTLLYHNPACSKSRAACEWLESRGVAFGVVDYLQSPPSIAQFADLLKALALEPRGIMRRDEALYAELGLDSPTLGDEALIAALVQYPSLLQRPILHHRDRAVIARPAERMLEILADLS